VIGRRAVSIALAIGLVGGGCTKRHPKEDVQPEAKPETPDRPEARGVPPRRGRPAVPAAPEGLLAPGAVGELQAALADRGYLKTHSKGELDEPTSAAVERFQRDEGLAATGMPDRETLRRLGISAEKAYGR
jgi:peptidoglycan hydrolase-like protein with peptidoglycan-binding domain